MHEGSPQVEHGEITTAVLSEVLTTVAHTVAPPPFPVVVVIITEMTDPVVVVLVGRPIGFYATKRHFPDPVRLSMLQEGIVLVFTVLPDLETLQAVLCRVLDDNHLFFCFLKCILRNLFLSENHSFPDHVRQWHAHY